MSINVTSVRRSVIGIGVLALTMSVLVAPTAQAVPKKPGLYGPTQVTAGQEVTYTAVFKGAGTKGGCFSPLFDYSDRNGGTSFILGGICLSSSKKTVFKRQVDKDKHVFAQPGVYTVTVDAAAMPNGGGSVQEKYARVKGGPKSYSLRVTVVADPVSNAEEPADSEGVS
jgi:hypothetical protein